MFRLALPARLGRFDFARVGRLLGGRSRVEEMETRDPCSENHSTFPELRLLWVFFYRTRHQHEPHGLTPRLLRRPDALQLAMPIPPGAIKLGLSTM